MNPAPSPIEFAERVAQGELRAVARAISLVEDRRPAARASAIQLLRELARRGSAAGCHRVGITGPPGAGKSSLVSALTRALRASGRRVGVLAVDPSSPRSGGALLGDRARIEYDPQDAGVFVRSMASGGQLGGLARAAGAAVEVLSAAFQVVIIETTGVGQSETDVEHVADTVLLVVQPASGDVLQFLKAGIVEIPDLFVVNKADLGAVAQRTHAEARAALGALLEGTSRSTTPPVLLTSASQGTGLDLLVQTLDERWQVLSTSALSARRKAAAGAWALRLFIHRVGERGVERSGGLATLRHKFELWIDEGCTAIEAAAKGEADLGE